MSRILITGATGTIGRALIDRLKRRGEQIVVLTRDRAGAERALGGEVEAFEWSDPKAAPPPLEALQRADAVVHLLGEPVAQRWTAQAKREIRDSRVLGTRSLVAALHKLAPGERPRVFVSQSAVGYYGDRGEEPVDEDAPAGDDFLARVVVEWEREAMAAPEETRVVRTRTGIVLAARGGALAQMLPFFRLGLGGRVASGRQYVPWIHLDDVLGAYERCLYDEGLDDAVNLTAPDPVTNAELTRALARTLHRPAVAPVPAVALRLLYGEMAQVLTTGQRAVPARLQRAGHTFAHTELEPALQDLLRG